MERKKEEKSEEEKKTRLLILGSKKFKKSSVTSLIEESEKRFDSVLFVPVNKVRIVEENGLSKLYYKDIDLIKFDAIYPRLSSRDYFLAEPILGIIEKHKIYCPVSLYGYHISNHKYHTIKVLSGKKVPVLLTSLSISPDVVKQTVESFGFPVVIKLISGFAGKGVMFLNTQQELHSILDTVHLFEDCVSAQKFVEAQGKDIRCYVTGEKVISVERTGAKEDFRANISRGGKAKEIKASKEVEKTARQVAKMLKLDICAVDFIQSEEGFVVIEVNFMPGPFKKFLGNKIVKDWADFLYSKVARNNKRILKKDKKPLEKNFGLAKGAAGFSREKLDRKF